MTSLFSLQPRGLVALIAWILFMVGYWFWPFTPILYCGILLVGLGAATYWPP